MATPAWQRKAGKSKSGGLNRKGVASYKRGERVQRQLEILTLE